MNIAFFTDTYLPQINGVVTSIEIFREALERKGHNVYIYAPYIGGKKKIIDPPNVFRFKSAKFLFQPEYRISLPFSRSLAQFQMQDIDIIHAHTPFTMGLLGLYLAKKYDIPLVHTYHTLFSEYVHYLPVPTDYGKSFAVWASKSYCNNNQAVIVPALRIKEELENYGVTTPIVVIPTGIMLTSYFRIDTAPIAEKYQLDPSCDYLVTIARLGKEKNIPFLLRSFQKVAEQKPNARFILIGDGPERKNLEKEAKKLGILEKLVFTGYVDRSVIFPLLKASKIFVFASKTETQGLVILEALSMKVPAVAVDAMGVSSVLEDGQGGFLSPEDETVFAGHVLSMLNDEKLYQAKRREAFQKAFSLSANKMARKLVNTYKSNLNKS